MKSLVGQQVGFKLKRKRCVKSAISNHGFQLVSMKIISHLVLYCYVLLTVFIVCLGGIKDIVFIVVSCVSLFRQIFFYNLIVLASTRKVEFDQTLVQLIHFVTGGTFLAGFFNWLHSLCQTKPSLLLKCMRELKENLTSSCERDKEVDQLKLSLVCRKIDYHKIQSFSSSSF